MSVDVQITDEAVVVTAGEYDTDGGVIGQVDGDDYPRIHLTPQGLLLQGDGTAPPVAPVQQVTLQDSYEFSSDPEITTDATRGAVSIKRGSSADTDDLLTGANGAGTQTFAVNGNGRITSASLTASEIVGTDASKNLVSLPVATYPSLTELSYVKGLTSAVQTQINARSLTAWNPIPIVKGSDESVANSDVLQDDDALTVAIGASETWEVDFIVAYSGNATPDLKFTGTAPSGATSMLLPIGLTTTDTITSGVKNLGSITSPGTALTAGTAGVGVHTLLRITGTVFNSTNAGSVTLQWAQNASGGSAVTVHKGSVLLARRIA